MELGLRRKDAAAGGRNSIMSFGAVKVCNTFNFESSKAAKCCGSCAHKSLDFVSSEKGSPAIQVERGPAATPHAANKVLEDKGLCRRSPQPRRGRTP